VGSPNTSYVQYVYVGAGVTTRAWTVTMPATPGNYEFRLFLNNSYTRSATSPAVAVGSGAPVLSSLSPNSASVGAPGFTLTATGSGFTPGSMLRWNGSDRPTTYVSGSQLTAAIPATDLAAAGTAQVTVFVPGGGVSAALPFTVGSASTALLSVSSQTVTGGSPVSVTLTGGPGGSTDWLSFASSSAGAASYLQYTYVGNGVTTRTWTVTTPLAAGTYEFRLYLNNSYTIAARSPLITVTQGPNPTPSISSLSPNRIAVGSASANVTVTGAGFVSSSIVKLNGAARPTTFLSASQLRVALSGSDLATTGTSQITVVSPAPGGGTSAPLAIDVVPPPTLTVSATNAAAGTPVTVTLTNGFGGSSDWLGFSATGSPDNSYITYVYIGNGVTTRTWTVTMPATPGTYEFRFYPNNSYTRVATSPPITVF
jgi:hypothetical protein